MKTIIAYKDSRNAASIKDVDDRRRVVTGYFSSFNVVDADGDMIVRGAFAKTIKENGPESEKPRIKHLLNHDTFKPIGVLTKLVEDNYGLYYESRIGTHSTGNDFVKMAMDGLITEHSIGYRAIIAEDVSKDRSIMEGGLLRIIKEIRLYEGSSLTAWGANPDTPLLEIKSEIDIKKLIEKAEAIDRFCRNSTATDDTIESLLIYNKQLVQLLAKSVATKSGNTPPVSNSRWDWAKLKQLLLNN